MLSGEQTYPRDTIAVRQCGSGLLDAGTAGESARFRQPGTPPRPPDRYAYDNMAAAYEALNRFDEAKSISEEAVAKKFDGAACTSFSPT